MMEIGTFKTLIKASMNISNDHKVPVYQTIEKNKEYETRLYEKTKYAFIKYQTVDDASKSSKSGYDMVMKNVVKLMKYTQGENDKKIAMPFIMPVFVHIETLHDCLKPNGTDSKLVEVKVMVCLPPEFQQHEPPLPLDCEIEIAELEQFKCFVRTFSGFASDDDYKNHAKKLTDVISREKSESVDFNANKIICISYDAPYVLVGRRNEVQIIYS